MSDDQGWSFSFNLLVKQSSQKSNDLLTVIISSDSLQNKKQWIEALRKAVIEQNERLEQLRPTKKEGYLVKRGHIVKNWKEVRD